MQIHNYLPRGLADAGVRLRDACHGKVIPKARVLAQVICGQNTN